MEGIEKLLRDMGAVLVGFADLRALPEEVRQGLPYGISFAVAVVADPDRAPPALRVHAQTRFAPTRGRPTRLRCRRH